VVKRCPVSSSRASKRAHRRRRRIRPVARTRTRTAVAPANRKAPVNRRSNRSRRSSCERSARIWTARKRCTRIRAARAAEARGGSRFSSAKAAASTMRTNNAQTASSFPESTCPKALRLPSSARRIANINGMTLSRCALSAQLEYERDNRLKSRIPASQATMENARPISPWLYKSMTTE
jgi:hypothetical protein